jgi:hypothetical protein
MNLYYAYSETACTNVSVTVTELLSSSRLFELPVHQQMTTLDTSDLLALQNAAHMLQEHVKLSSMEAAVTVQDTIRAQSSAHEWRARALETEKALLRMHKENVDLKNANEKLAAEHRLLVTELRKVRKQVAMNSNHLESYMANALTFHEQQLKMSKTSKEGNKEQDGVDDGELVCSRTSTSEASSYVADKDRGGSAADVAGESENTLGKPDNLPPSPPLQPLELQKFEFDVQQ